MNTYLFIEITYKLNSRVEVLLIWGQVQFLIIDAIILTINSTLFTIKKQYF